MTTAAGHVVDRAEWLAARGQAAAGVALLETAAARGDAEAAFTLAIWLFSGRVVRRDPAAARGWFGRAGALGHGVAAAIHTAFVCNGTGGPADWPAAMALLRQRAADDPAARAQATLIDGMALRADGSPSVSSAPAWLSSDPAIGHHPNFFTPAECRYLIEAASPMFEPSVVVDPRTGRMLRDPIRTSDVAAFPLALENPAIHALNRRIAGLTETACDQGEPLQILRYAPGQEYRAHLDSLRDADNQRDWTVLVYLNDEFIGGATLFDRIDLRFVPKRGDALFFRNVDGKGMPDPRTRHVGEAVRSGSKFVASRWIRRRPIQI